jgi:type VII secretion protein EccB
MAREPVTRMQLDAYRFGQRRLESALARRDPVLLHEEIRAQRRVVTVGLALAMLGLVAAFGYARVAGRTAWEQQSIIAAKQSGRMFVVIHRPDRLVPVRNLAAARLVLAAARGASGRGGAPAGTPTAIDDVALDKAPRTALAAVPGADGVALPDGDDVAAVGPWAVCDVTQPGAQTILVAGASSAPDGTPRPLRDEQGLLLESPDHDVYLVMRSHRYRLDSVDAAQRAYDLVDVTPRKVSAALLSAIPEGRPIRTPTIPHAGEAGPDGLPAEVGEVVRTAGDAPGPGRYYLVLADGVKEISEPVADLIRADQKVDGSRPPMAVSPQRINSIGREREALPSLDQFPPLTPKVPLGADGQALCWQWDGNGRGGSVTLGAQPPVPADQPPTQLAQADGLGPELDMVSVPTGVPVAVSAIGGEGGGNGLWLVSDTGVGYQVAAGQNGNNETANALGIQPDAAGPAPAQALRLLPRGPDLDLQSATRTVDVLVDAGDGWAVGPSGSGVVVAPGGVVGDIAATGPVHGEHPAPEGGDQREDAAPQGGRVGRRVGVVAR